MRCKILFLSQVRKTQVKADPGHSYVHGWGGGGGQEEGGKTPGRQGHQ